jgi:predicted ABC-type transport system involved in lysophospholipase L1 biosynthesis ATPase subunit
MPEDLFSAHADGGYSRTSSRSARTSVLSLVAGSTERNAALQVHVVHSPSYASRCERMYGESEALYSVIQCIFVARAECGEAADVVLGARGMGKMDQACCGGFRRRHETGLVFRVFGNFSYG